MEEVWKDINLSDSTQHNTTNFRSIMFGDFLARPFSKDSVLPTVSNGAAAADSAALYGSPVLPPATVVSLNSGPEFNFLSNSKSSENVSSFNSLFEPLASASELPSFGKKRFQESENTCGDRRHKRMIKNRESAARSRARKQAYTTELELEVAHLMEENERLKRQQEQLCVAAAAQLPKKHNLHRTSTAPF